MIPASPTAALTATDDGTLVVPASLADWNAWVSASKTRNWMLGDPLLDWLDLFGVERDFVPDTQLPDYDSRTDMLGFLIEQGHRFEAAVAALIRDRLETTRIGAGWEAARDLSKAVETVEAMVMGVPAIEQAVLRNPQNRTYGVADLLVRSDYLDRLVPDTIGFDAASRPAPGLGATSWHYVVVDIKLRTLDLLADGGAGGKLRHYMAQVWLYNNALGRIQGFTPPASYLLGRSWKQGEWRGDSCFDRLARVDHDRLVVRNGEPLADEVAAAVAWVQRLRAEGASWQVLPEPSVPELYPHARNHEDQPWHTAKVAIADALAELTLLPGMAPPRRRLAHAHGMRRWDDPAVSAGTLAVEAQYAAQCDAVLMANRDEPSLVVVPATIALREPDWRNPAALEFYVDFETVNNLADDFSRLPKIGGQSLIFQIGCGRWERGEWLFEQWTVDRLVEADEAAMIDAWVVHMEELRMARGVEWSDVRIIHWSPAEDSTLSSAYNSARRRHPDRSWPALPWFDFLVQVIRREPVAVRGQFAFGLKGIAKGMHSAGLISTVWGDGPADGLGAMVGAWWCDDEAERRGTSIRAFELMRAIEAYNQVDCRAMAEIIQWLRTNR